jgi:N-acetyl-gamma-glutamyl-phosphate reductase
MLHIHSTAFQSKLTASIVGARGYSGLELARLLLRHPAVSLTYCFATRPFRLEEEIFAPGASAVTCLTDDQLFARPLTDIVFLATPAEVSLEMAPKILAAGKRVIDLSGAFRLKQNDPKPWYGFAAADREFLEQTQYGLVPFCGPLGANLIANPGCYASAVSLALIPLLKHNLIEAEALVIDAKSGTTGAGRKADENLLFSEVEGGCLPYRVGRHQHFPEICETVAAFSGHQIDPHFVTHLLPVRRGITAAVFARAKTAKIEDITLAYQHEYERYPLVRHGTDVTRLGRIQNVVGTPYTHISYNLTGNKLYVFTALDNLMKGAASQAVENLNRVLDLPPHFSLIQEE